MNGAVLNCNFYVIGGRSVLSSGFVGTNDNQKFTCPCASPTPTPTPTPFVNISGTVTYCATTPAPVTGATMTLTGGAGGSTLTSGTGAYTFASVQAGLNYTVTPSKAARAPGSAGINTVDVLAVQKHFLIITPLVGCHVTAADVNGSGTINTVDVLAIQKFFLIISGSANTGQYKFTPASRTYTPLNANQPTENYDTVIFGDVISTFVNPARPEGASQDAAE